MSPELVKLLKSAGFNEFMEPLNDKYPDGIVAYVKLEGWPVDYRVQAVRTTWKRLLRGVKELPSAPPVVRA